MSETNQKQSIDYIELAAEIVAAYVSKNSLSAAELPALLRNTYTALASLSEAPAATAVSEEVTAEKPTSAQIRQSITPDALVSFIDGKPYKTLKRHLTTRGLDPQSYRRQYGLPNDYPMVAPSYAKRRSELAKAIGLGRPGAMAEAANDQAAKPRRKAS